MDKLINSGTHQRGFTIVELLIVIVVIGILAAITIVAYNGIQARAADTAIQSDLRNLQNKIEIFKVDNDKYPGGASSPAELTGLDFKATKSAYATTSSTNNHLWYCRNGAQSHYSVVALSKSGNIFYITKSAQPTKYTGGLAWSPTSHNCNTLIDSGQGWQYAGFVHSDAGSSWRAWVGGV